MYTGTCKDMYVYKYIYMYVLYIYIQVSPGKGSALQLPGFAKDAPDGFRGDRIPDAGADRRKPGSSSTENDCGW